MSKSEVIDKQRQRIFSFDFEGWQGAGTPVGQAVASALDAEDHFRRMLLNGTPSERLGLDLENLRNFHRLRPLVRLAVHGRRRTAALTGKIPEAAARRFRDFYAP